jgi:glycosyltransferase involved in cell wall biosynthesis
LNSIQAQTFPDFEVLLIDDGSTDGSGRLCDEFCLSDYRFKVRHQDNQGCGIARNAGLDWAVETDSKYIVWVDADDLIAPNYLEKMMSVIKKYPQYNIVQCGYTEDYCKFNEYILVDNNSSVEKYEMIDDEEQLLLEMINGHHGMAFQLLWNKLCRKDVYRYVRVVSDNNVSGKIYNDVNMLWQLYINAQNCIIIPNVLYYYRYVEGSIQHNKIGINKLEIFYLYKKIYKECMKRGYRKFAEYLSERIIWVMAMHLSKNKKEYQNYKQYYIEEKCIYNELKKEISFICRRMDIKMIYLLGNINFVFFRIYGKLYCLLRDIRNDIRGY